MSRVYIFLLALTTSFLAINSLGYDHFQCPSPSPSQQALLDCDADCRVTHTAENGVCGNASDGDFSCYCGALKTGRSSRSLQCKKGLSQKQYTQLCQLDCKCNHGSAQGTCNFETSGCECSGVANASTCEFAKLADYLNKVIQILQTILAAVPV